MLLCQLLARGREILKPPILRDPPAMIYQRAGRRVPRRPKPRAPQIAGSDCDCSQRGACPARPGLRDTCRGAVPGRLEQQACRQQRTVEQVHEGRHSGRSRICRRRVPIINHHVSIGLEDSWVPGAVIVLVRLGYCAAQFRHAPGAAAERTTMNIPGIGRGRGGSLRSGGKDGCLPSSTAR